MSYVEYGSNNSGGEWWLSDEQWRALELAGWEVVWGGMYFCRTRFNLGRKRPAYLGDADPCANSGACPGHRLARSYAEALELGDDARWLGALAMSAFLRGATSLRDAAKQWERVTGMDATDAGCQCCGQPHTFTLYDDNGKWVEAGPSTSYTASWED